MGHASLLCTICVVFIRFSGHFLYNFFFFFYAVLTNFIAGQAANFGRFLAVGGVAGSSSYL